MISNAVVLAAVTPGKGRGVVTTADVAPGELLLCCHPLGVVTGKRYAYTVRAVGILLALTKTAFQGLQRFYSMSVWQLIPKPVSEQQ